ncbi:hypothetical protein B808_393 [Fructilactobacillus florum 8D]|uniref:Pyridoxamine 5'-phosphate oxidase N-terminal domain-containing protein n=1 Tax=Fructilactobacillus florum 8D TaxID=1221538 RepID=W9EHJ2_9LACO|nr:pyridoxamine 5'-phosphate oxidase family protein [Fructilactobacillus florum]EKK21141.1 hypothetical protein B807_117 [Fructilactobacillus florum 2F]ETO40731.1 hypothetical protein B808_393 [Fructilactobacillus florum 8D]
MKNTLTTFKEITHAVENINLATVSEEGIVSNSIVTFNQDDTADNVYYVLTNYQSHRAQNIITHPQVAVSSWFEQKSGKRFSSNNATAKVHTDLDFIAAVAGNHPAMTKFGTDFSGKCILEITLKSALIEDFAGNVQNVEF